MAEINLFRGADGEMRVLIVPDGTSDMTVDEAYDLSEWLAGTKQVALMDSAHTVRWLG